MGVLGSVTIDVVGEPQNLWNGTPGAVVKRQPNKRHVMQLRIIANEDNSGDIVVAPSDDVVAAVATRQGMRIIPPGLELVLKQEPGESPIDVANWYADATTAGDRVRWVGFCCPVAGDMERQVV